MDPFKIVGGIMIILGFAFRGICIAQFRLRTRLNNGNEKAQRKLLASQKRAMLIDMFFIATGFWIILTH